MLHHTLEPRNTESEHLAARDGNGILYIIVRWCTVVPVVPAVPAICLLHPLMEGRDPSPLSSGRCHAATAAPRGAADYSAVAARVLDASTREPQPNRPGTSAKRILITNLLISRFRRSSPPFEMKISRMSRCIFHHISCSVPVRQTREPPHLLHFV